MKRILTPGGWLVYAAVPAALFVILWMTSAGDQSLVIADSYIYVVTAAAFLAGVLAVIAAIVATGLIQYRMLMIGLALLAIAALYAAHGLATPGFIVAAGNAAPAAFAARLGLLVPAALLAGAAFPPPRALRDRIVRNRAVVLAICVGGLAAFAAGTLAFPSAIPAAVSGDAFRLATLVATVLLAVTAACRFALSDGHRSVESSGALIAGSLLIFEAQLGEHFAPTWTAAWWLYHGQLLAGFAALFWVVLAEYIRSEMRGAAAPSAPAPLSDASRLTEFGYEGVVRSFVTSVEARGGYTPDHGRRVAILSVFIGMELRLPADRLHAIARGALLRDVGMISVPDAILAKPEQLTPE